MTEPTVTANSMLPGASHVATDRRTKRWVLALILASGVAFGAAIWHFYPGQLPPAIDWSFVVVLALLAYVWFRTDARQRDYRRSKWLNMAVAGAYGLALPSYFIRSRGWRGGLLQIFFMLLFFAAFCLAGLGAMTVSWYLQLGP